MKKKYQKNLIAVYFIPGIHDHIVDWIKGIAKKRYVGKSTACRMIIMSYYEMMKQKSIAKRKIKEAIENKVLMEEKDGSGQTESE